MKKKQNNLSEINSPNPYEFVFNIMVNNLKLKNIYEGLKRSLKDCQKFMSAEGMFLYRISNNNTKLFRKSSRDDNLEKNITDIVKDYSFYKKCELKIVTTDNREKNLDVIPITVDENSKYILISVNSNIENKDSFTDLLSETFGVILEKMEQYFKIKKISETDALTRVRNRMGYQSLIKNLFADGVHDTIYVLADLFRLKYVNDHFNHDTGDNYIMCAAKALKKAFPEHENIMDENGNVVKKEKTNDYIFRIGGDEFVVICVGKTEEYAAKKMEYATWLLQKYISDLNSINDSLHLTINYGISAADDENTDIKKLYKSADEILEKNKRNIYSNLNIERRK